MNTPAPSSRWDGCRPRTVRRRGSADDRQGCSAPASRANARCGRMQAAIALEEQERLRVGPAGGSRSHCAHVARRLPQAGIVGIGVADHFAQLQRRRIAVRLLRQVIRQRVLKPVVMQDRRADGTRATAPRRGLRRFGAAATTRPQRPRTRAAGSRSWSLPACAGFSIASASAASEDFPVTAMWCAATPPQR